MKTSLRVLSVVLTLTMLIGLMPMAAFAAEATDAADVAVIAAPDVHDAPSEKEAGSATIELTGWTYGQKANAPVYSSKTNQNVTPVVTYKPQGAQDDAYTDKVPVNAGAYTVKVVYPATDTHTEAVNTCDFTISKAVVSEVKLDSVTFPGRAYNGTTDLTIPAEPQLPMAFTVGKEDVAPVMGRDYEAKLVLKDAKPDTDPQSLNAVLNVTLKDSGNYALENKDVKTEFALHVDIAKADITITAADQVLPNGTEISQELNQVSVTPALVSGDALTQITLTEEIPEGQSNGTITPSAAVIKDGDADHSEFYRINYVPGKSIHSAAVTQPPVAFGSLTYDGTAQALLTAGTADHGTMEYRLDASAEWSQEIPTAKDAGEYKIYYRAKGIDGFADSAETDLTVKIAPKTVKATATAEKAYDGSDAADAFMKIEVPSDAFGKDDVKVDGIEGSKFASNMPGQQTVTPGTVKLSGADSKNYVVTIDPFQGTIQQPEAPIVTKDPTPAEGLVYNGQAQSLVASQGEAVGGSKFLYRINQGDWVEALPSATTAGKYTISYKVVNGDKESAEKSFEVTIAHKALTATATAEKVYDGNVFTKDAKIDFVLNKDGIVGNDKVEIQSIQDSTFKTAGAGTDIPVSAGHVVLTGDHAENYIVTVEKFTGKITPKPITVTAPSLSKRYGQVDPSIKPTVSENGLVGSDKLVGTLSRTEGENVGVYPISQGSVTNANNPNYNITFQDGKLTVQPAKTTMKIKLSRTSAVAGRNVTITVTAVNGEENLMTENWNQPEAPRLLVGSKDLKLEATDTAGVWKCTYKVPKDAKGSLVFNVSNADDTENYLKAEASAKLKIGNSVSPLTGDQRNPVLYATIAGVAAAALIVLLLVNKKKKSAK